MKNAIVLRLVVFFVLTTLFLKPAASASEEESAGGHAAIDVVICLDVSGSMQDLLDAVRIRVWDVVAELWRLEPDLELRVGLLAYGSGSRRPEDGWMAVESDLSHDLDHVYGALMEVEVGGDEELVAQAITTAVETMAWSPSPEALKILFVAGNEPLFTDAAGERALTDALELAESRGVIVNALYAGERDQALSERWGVLADLGRGNFSAIDPHSSRIQVPTPQDEALIELNDQLNRTYLPYGPSGRDGFANQVAQDTNATRLGVESCSSRIVAKGSAFYDNASWDLVDATLKEGFRWSSLTDEDLPEEMRPMALEERRAYVKEKRRQRESIQQAIQELSAEREAFLRQARDDREDSSGLGETLFEAIRAQYESGIR